MKNGIRLLATLHLFAASTAWTQINCPDQQQPQQGEQGWVQVPSNTTTPRLGIVFANEEVLYCTGNGLLQKSTDGGLHWFELPNAPQIGQMHFFTQDEGIGGRQTLPPNIFRTSDGGVTWDTLSREEAGNSDMGRPGRMQFLNPSFGYAAGQSSILRSFDGGDSWEVKIVGALGYTGIHFADAKHGYAVGERQVVEWGEPEEGLFERTDDGGEHWERVRTKRQYSFADIRALSPNYLVLCAVGGFIARSTDRGDTWSDTLLTQLGNGISSIDFIGGIGYAVGSKGRIFKTLDSAKSWNEQTTPTTSRLLGVDFLHENLGLAVGENGVILRTSDGGQSWVQVHPPLQEITVLSYPEPFTKSVKLRYILDKPCSATITVYSISGKKMTDVTVDKQLAGENTVTINAAGWPPGVYLYTLHACDYTASGRITLVPQP